MKIVALLLAFGILSAALANEPPTCKSFVSKMTTTTCGESVQSWNKSTLKETYFYTLSETGQNKSPKMLRAIQITDPNIKAKTLHAEGIMAKLKYSSIPKIEESIEFEGWRIQKYNRGMGDFFIASEAWITERDDSLTQKYLHHLKELSEMIKYVNSEGYVITNLNENSFLLATVGESKAYFSEFGETVQKDSAIDDRGDFHYWEPSRLNGEEKVWTEKADHYAFGVTLFKALHGNRFPFAGETKEEYAKNVNIGDYEIGTTCPPELAYIIAKLLQKDPKNRISLHDLIAVLNYLQGNKLQKFVSNPIKLNNQKPLPQELLNKLDTAFISFAKSFDHTIDIPQEVVNEPHQNFWLTSKGIMLIAGLALILLALIVWAIVSCLQKNPDAPTIDQKLTTGLDNTKDVETPVQNQS